MPTKLLKTGNYIVKVPAERVSKNWDYFKYYIENALPPTSTPHAMLAGNLLKAILSGDLQCWCACSVNGEGGGIVAIFTTRISFDPIAGEKNLILYSLTGTKGVGLDVYLDGRDSLQKYAEKQGCQKIVAYTSIHTLGVLAKKMGAEVSLVVTMEV